MKKAINKFSDILYRVYMALACALIIVLTFSSAVQVIFRYFVNNSQAWTEETARYCFIWASMLGAACLVKSGGHAVVDFVVKGLKGKARTIQQIIVLAVIFAFGGLLIVKSFPLLKIVAQQKSSVLKLPMWMIYLATPVGGFGMCVHALNQFVNFVSSGFQYPIPADGASEAKGE